MKIPPLMPCKLWLIYPWWCLQKQMKMVSNMKLLFHFQLFLEVEQIMHEQSTENFSSVWISLLCIGSCSLLNCSSPLNFALFVHVHSLHNWCKYVGNTCLNNKWKLKGLNEAPISLSYLLSGIINTSWHSKWWISRSKHFFCYFWKERFNFWADKQESLILFIVFMEYLVCILNLNPWPKSLAVRI